MCVVGGEGSSDSFHFPKFQGVQHMLSRGRGRQTFFQGGGVQLLSDRTCDCPRSRSAQLHVSRNLINYSDSLAVYFLLSSCTHLEACFTLIEKCDLAGSLFYRCVGMIGFCAWIKGNCRFSACKLGFSEVCICIHHAQNCSPRHSQKVPI